MGVGLEVAEPFLISAGLTFITAPLAAGVVRFGVNRVYERNPPRFDQAGYQIQDHVYTALWAVDQFQVLSVALVTPLMGFIFAPQRVDRVSWLIVIYACLEIAAFVAFFIVACQANLAKYSRRVTFIRFKLLAQKLKGYGDERSIQRTVLSVVAQISFVTLFVVSFLLVAAGLAAWVVAPAGS